MLNSSSSSSNTIEGSALPVLVGNQDERSTDCGTGADRRAVDRAAVTTDRRRRRTTAAIAAGAGARIHRTTGAIPTAVAVVVAAADFPIPEDLRIEEEEEEVVLLR
jgi:hypothetical protein